MRRTDKDSIAARVWLLGVLACLGLGGCQAYVLQGIVVAGPTSNVEVVGDTDPRLLQTGLANVTVDLTLDPGGLEPKPINPAMTSQYGVFSIPIHEAGAGFLEYELGVVCHYKGARWLADKLPLPSSKKRLLITLGPAPGGSDLDPDILKNTIQQGNDLLDTH